MKLTLAAAALLAASTQSVDAAKCVETAFEFDLSGTCNYDTVLAAFTEFFDDHGNIPEDCANDAATELAEHLGGRTVYDLCVEAFANFDSIGFGSHIVPGEGGMPFVDNYYDGFTNWNEEVETEYPLDADGNPTQVLRRTAEQVDNIYEGDGQYGIIEWPEINNFDADKCEANAAYCCFASDRQANDNNGNCDDPYDAKCVDTDPGDNTNLCHLELDNDVIGTGYTGEDGHAVFPGDGANNNRNAGEGPIHCHGFAWSNDDTHASSVFKGNNLFYVSMYDHFHQRGYVRNVPGAPMCACAEAMPTVERADCTQINLEDQEFKFMFMPKENDATVIEPKATRVDINFAACQGFDLYGKNDNNDLWSYMNRLFREGHVTREQFIDLGKKLVGEQPDRCNLRTEEFMHENGYIKGHKEDPDVWEMAAGKGFLTHAGVSKEGFRELMDDAPTHPDDNTDVGKIIKRVCIDCSSLDHKFIYYKRRTPVPADFDLLWNLKNERSEKAGNKWEEDFMLYSKYEDAVNDVNPWKCQNNQYRYNHGFPGGCSPSGAAVFHQDTRFYWPHGRQHVSFSVEKDQDARRSRTTTDNPHGDKFKKLDETYELGYTRQEGASYEFVDEADNATKILMVGYGHDIWHYEDSATFHAENMTAGDKFEVAVKIESFNAPQHWGKVGLMIRKDPMSAGAKNIFFGQNRAGDVWIQQRSQPYQGVNNNNVRTWSYGSTRNHYEQAKAQGGYWLKLKYDANYIHTFIGVEDENGEPQWQSFYAPRAITFTGECHVGVVISSQSHGYYPAEAVYSGYESVTHVCEAQRRKRHLMDYRLNLDL